ncbi:peptidylprolyl isomerase [Oceanispirochaeta crateris]|uniref:Peptidyl-prolyl cis-trans isomerase n=1 Tax=Oceanispirochaeta crateris TaxID=2518645 RepID=A0A5C1QQ29_9SPIO|nr:peptidylprolyl isomerase [Oceanispirochaeta crateris]QEN09701.1 peptidylprolyl isomerase [Oceanispirochaeta crateris]
MKINGKCVVSMDYKLRNEAGEILDASGTGDPLVFLHGVGALVPGLEKELNGKTSGDTLRVKVSPAEGYGEHMPQLIQKLPKESFQGVDDIEVGMEFQASSEDGHVMVVRVDSIDGDEITINGNHPLAGMTLDFEVGITDVREATAEELEHGHVHGAHGHH